MSAVYELVVPSSEDDLEALAWGVSRERPVRAELASWMIVDVAAADAARIVARRPLVLRVSGTERGVERTQVIAYYRRPRADGMVRLWLRSAAPPPLPPAFPPLAPEAP